MLKSEKMEMNNDEGMIPKPKRRVFKKLLGLLLIIGAVAALAWGVSQLKSSAISNEYQAVFLVNGQVYFGKLATAQLNSNFVTLKDVFYIQVNQPLQPVERGKKQPEPQPQLILTKLGLQEIHGPKDEMIINREQILYIEELREDSQVVRGIKQFKSQPAK